jgi:hypothetical protein
MPAPKKHKHYNINGEGGRPLKYTKDFIEAEAAAFEDWMNRVDSIYFKNFALERGYHPQRLSEFAEENERFSEVYKRAQAWQENKLVEGGLTNVFNAGFTKFVLGNVCGWVEKQQTQLIGDAANPLAFLLQKADGGSKDLIANGH